MKNIFRFRVVVGLLLAAIVVVADQANAQTAPSVVVTQVPQATYWRLENAANEFRETGVVREHVLDLNMHDGQRRIRLRPHDIRHPNYRAIKTTDNGQVDDLPDIDFFRGEVEAGASDEFARFSLIRQPDGRKTFAGLVHVDEKFFSARAEAVNGGDALALREVTALELQAMVRACGVSAAHSHNSITPPTLPLGDGTTAAMTVQTIELATDADFQFFQALGSSSSSANAEVLSIVNDVDGIYQSQLSLALSVTFQNVFTTSGSNPYTTNSSELLLDQFTDHWNSNFRGSQQYDIAHLFTGRNLNGGTVGIAFLGVVCSFSFQYGLSEYQNNATLDAVLTAHEIGHNLNAQHDSCGSTNYVMCPFLNSSTEFSETSKNDIASFVASISCLTSGGGGGTNSAPTLTDPGAQNVDEGQLLTLQLQASDPDGDALTFSESNGLPDGASLDSTSGVFSWRPNGDQAGSYNLLFEVRDPSGESDEVTVSITVNEVNGVAGKPAMHIHGDFAGQGFAPATVFRHSDGVWYSGSFNDTDLVFQQFGLSGDIPVDGDYNGDNISDRAIFRPSTNTWFILMSGSGATVSVSFGLEGDIPVVGDFDGDGRDDVAIFRPSQGLFVYRSSSDGTSDVVDTTGSISDVPVPCDYDGDGTTDFATFTPSTGNWTIKQSSTSSETTVQLGIASDFPVPNYYDDGDNQCDVAVWRPSSGEWFIDGASTIQFGLPGDVPVPLDTDGDGTVNPTVWRQSQLLWFTRDSGGSAVTRQLGLGFDVAAGHEQLRYAFRRRNNNGTPGIIGSVQRIDIYAQSQATLYSVGVDVSTTSISLNVPDGGYILRGDYNGDHILDVAVFNAGLWTISFLDSTGAVTSTQNSFWGLSGDIPVTGDYDNDGSDDLAVYRSGTGGGVSQWFVILSSTGTGIAFNWGLDGDIPVPADFNGDGYTDPTVFRPGFAIWFVADGRSGGFLEQLQWGLPGDVLRVIDLDSDGRQDKIVYRPSDSTWYANLSGGGIQALQFGFPGLSADARNFDSASSGDYVLYETATKFFYVRSNDGTQQIISRPSLPSSGTQLIAAPYDAVQ